MRAISNGRDDEETERLWWMLYVLRGSMLTCLYLCIILGGYTMKLIAVLVILVALYVLIRSWIKLLEEEDGREEID